MLIKTSEWDLNPKNPEFPRTVNPKAALLERNEKGK
jgi:hypothetical protein